MASLEQRLLMGQQLTNSAVVAGDGACAAGATGAEDCNGAGAGALTN